MEVRELRGGLLLAEETAAPEAIRKALKRIDPALILGQEVDHAWSMWLWRILYRRPDRSAVWLFDWRENMEDPQSRPRPLSFAIVEEAASRQRGSRRPTFDPLAFNDQLQKEHDEHSIEEALGVAEEVRRRPRSPVQRSQGLRRSRDKARARGENV